MTSSRPKTPLDEYVDDLWETCDFPRPKKPRRTMKAAHLQATENVEDAIKEDENIDDKYLDQLDPRHYRYVTDEIRKIRGERASDRNIEWILGRRDATATDNLKNDTDLKLYPVIMQSVEKSVTDTEYSSPTKSPINVKNRQEFPEL